MATVLAVVGVVAAVGSVVLQRKASKEQRKQNRIQNRIAKITPRRNIRRSVAERRVRAAEIQSLGFQLGVAGSTAVEGAVAGVTSDTAGAISQAGVQLTGQQAISNLSNRISSLQSSASTLQAIGGIVAPFAGSQGAQNRASIANLFV